jgi:hypothetical protein
MKALAFGSDVIMFGWPLTDLYGSGGARKTGGVGL